jgi:hypothetical protein
MFPLLDFCIVLVAVHESLYLLTTNTCSGRQNAFSVFFENGWLCGGKV